jgi:hypothetical protein
VAREFQHRGIATKLYERALQLALQQNFQRVRALI